MENEKICQSCGAPIGGEIAPGTNADGSLSEDYCCYCFTNGAFEGTVETVEEMIAECVPILVEDGTFPNEDVARTSLQEFLPTLKRWRTA